MTITLIFTCTFQYKFTFSDIENQNKEQILKKPIEKKLFEALTQIQSHIDKILKPTFNQQQQF